MIFYRNSHGESEYFNLFDYCHTKFDDMEGTETPLPPNEVDLLWIEFFVDPERWVKNKRWKARKK